jgi:hypothetical protein
MVTFEIVADMRFRTILSTDTRTIELSVLLDDYIYYDRVSFYSQIWLCVMRTTATKGNSCVCMAGWTCMIYDLSAERK